MTQKDVYVNLELFMVLAAHNFNHDIKLFDQKIVPILVKIGENTKITPSNYYEVYSDNITDVINDILSYTPLGIDQEILGKILFDIFSLKINTKIPFSNDEWNIYVYVQQDTTGVYHLQKITVHYELIEKAWNFGWFQLGYDVAHVEMYLYKVNIE